VSELPKGWIEVPVDDVCQIVRGITFPTSEKRFESGAGLIACLRTANVQANVEWDDLWFIPQRYVKNDEQLVTPDDILISTANSYELVGKVSRVTHTKFRSTLGAFISLLRTYKGVDAGFLYYQMSSESVQRSIREMSSTTTNISNVSGSKLKTLCLHLAPSAEQARIVAKVEELLTDLDAGVAELKAAQKKLAQYRQSLLKAAVEGALTAEWRTKHTPTETGAQLLERILIERRARWEAKQLAKFAEQGKTPPKDWQKKYPEPVQPDITDLPQLPEGWVWASVDLLLADIETGKSFKCEERPPRDHEVGVVKVSAVSWGEYAEQESKTCHDESMIRPELFVNAGDFLFSRANTIELVGACVIAQAVTKRVMLSDKILRLVLVNEKLKSWLLTLLRSEFGRKYIELLASGNQESMRNIGQERLKQIPVPLPCLKEIEMASELLLVTITAAREQEQAINLSLKQSTAQRQNILRAAFAGQLVPQDPNDEPAAVLLKRIRAERATRDATAKPRRGQTKKVG
jgi:type I restriction enzyme S subunit